MKNEEKDSLFTESFIKGQIYKDVSSKRELWKEIANLFNGKLTIKQTISKEAETLILKIPYKKVQIELIETDTKPLKFYFDINFLSKFEFNISWEDTIEKILKIFGRQDIIVGEEKFDRKYLIQSNNEDILKNIFADSNLKRLIIKHNIYLINCSYNKTKEKHEISTVINRTTDKMEILVELIKIQFLLFDRLEYARIIKK
ncbi:hypothetical protein ACFLSI_02820 [Bacteroidota bacterium]